MKYLHFLYDRADVSGIQKCCSEIHDEWMMNCFEGHFAIQQAQFYSVKRVHRCVAFNSLNRGGNAIILDLNATQHAQRDFRAVFSEIMENRLSNNARFQPFFGSKREKKTPVKAGENIERFHSEI